MDAEDSLGAAVVTHVIGDGGLDEGVAKERKTAEEFLSVFWRWGRQPVDGSDVEAEGKRNTGQAAGGGWFHFLR